MKFPCLENRYAGSSHWSKLNVDPLLAKLVPYTAIYDIRCVKLGVGRLTNLAFIHRA